MSNSIELVIVSQDKLLYKGFVDHVNVSAEEGELGIYPKHSPLLARLKPGIVSFIENGSNNAIYISGGFVEVQPNLVSILADVAIHGEELDRDRILRAKEACESKLQSHSENFDEISAKLKREIAKLKAYELMNATRNK